MKRFISIIIVSVMATGCTLTPQQRQQWSDFRLQASAVGAAVAPLAMAAGAYADIRNASNYSQNTNTYQNSVKKYRHGR